MAELAAIALVLTFASGPAAAEDDAAPPEAAASTPTSAPPPSPSDPPATEAAPELPPEPGPEPSTAPVGASPPSVQAPTPPVVPPNPAPTVAPKPAPAPPDIPIRWRLDVSLGPAATYVTDPAFLGLSRRRSTIGAAPLLALTWRLGDARRIFVGGGVGYRSSRQAGDMYGATFFTDHALDEALFFGRVGMVPVEGIDVLLDLGAGPSVHRVELADDQSGPTATDRDVLAVFDATVGAALYLPKPWLPNKGRSRVTGGVSGNIGYTFRNALQIDPAAEREDDAISTTSLPLGDVTLRGMSWRVGVFVRFM